MATINTQVGPYGMVPLWLFDRKLSAGAICLYTFLSARYGGLEAIYPSQPTLARALGVSVPTVQRWERDLRAAGALQVERRGLGRTSRYTLVQVPPAEEVQSAAPTVDRLDQLLAATPDSVLVVGGGR